jgi:hypothetical protein
MMATPAKRWPTNAEWARTDAISLARRGRRALVEELDHVSDVGLLRAMARTIEVFNEIERALSEVGPAAEKDS